MVPGVLVAISSTEPEIIYIEVPQETPEIPKKPDFTLQYFECNELSGDAVGYCQQDVAKRTLQWKAKYEG